MVKISKEREEEIMREIERKRIEQEKNRQLLNKAINYEVYLNGEYQLKHTFLTRYGEHAGFEGVHELMRVLILEYMVEEMSYIPVNPSYPQVSIDTENILSNPKEEKAARRWDALANKTVLKLYDAEDNYIGELSYQEIEF